MMVFYRHRNDSGSPRIGFAVGKILGGAVERNRIRRRMRAAVQRHLGKLTLPIDVIMHPRKAVLKMDFAQLESEVEQMFTAIQKGRQR